MIQIVLLAPSQRKDRMKCMIKGMLMMVEWAREGGIEFGNVFLRCLSTYREVTNYPISCARMTALL